MRTTALPMHVGVGLRSNHHSDFLDYVDQLSWIEVHSENYFGGGDHASFIRSIAGILPISLHGVGLSLGSHNGVDRYHLSRLKQLATDINPCQISDHVSWNMVNEKHLNDLLPLPYTEESLDVICRNIDHVQETLCRTILVENPSTYLQYGHSTIPETTFLSEIVTRTGCGLLLDVNNVYVNSYNHHFDPYDYIRHIPGEFVQEIHLAGHTKRPDMPLLVDTHTGTVSNIVMDLYAATIRQMGMKPSLIEWDTDTPALPILIQEASRIEQVARESVHAALLEGVES